MTKPIAETLQCPFSLPLMAGKGQDIDTTVVVDRIVPGPSVAWSEDSRAPEAKSKEGQDATIASNPSDKGASGASTAARRRRPATSLDSEKDSRSTTRLSSSSNATRRWINFPHDRLLAFGVSNFEETCEFAVPAGVLTAACAACLAWQHAHAADSFACCRLAASLR